MRLTIIYNFTSIFFHQLFSVTAKFGLVLPFFLKLNRELYNVMKKLENQHSGKAFIVKGLNRSAFTPPYHWRHILFAPITCHNPCATFSSVSGKSKKRKSIVISNPIPCNTAFPADHVSIHSSTENAKDPVYATPIKSQSVSEEPQEGSVSSKDVHSSDSDLSSSGANTSQRQSVCDNESSDGGAESQGPQEAEIEPEAEEEVKEKDAEEEKTSQSDHSAAGALKSEGENQEESEPSDSANGDVAQSPEPEEASDPPSGEARPKPPPVPAPRVSFRSTDQRPLLSVAKAEKKETPFDQEDLDSGDNCSVNHPPGFLYKVRCPLWCTLYFSWAALTYREQPAGETTTTTTTTFNTMCEQDKSNFLKNNANEVRVCLRLETGCRS